MHSPAHKLIEARKQLKHRHPRLGAVLDMINIKDVDHETWNTVSVTTDGKTIWYNAKFVNLHSVDELVFCLGYMSHVIRDRLYEDTAALEGVERWRLNLAQCYLVHSRLVRAGVGKLPRDAVMHHGIQPHMSIGDALAVVPTDEAQLEQRADLSGMRTAPR